MRVYSLVWPSSHLICCIRSATVARSLRRNLYLRWSRRVLHVTSMPAPAAMAMPEWLSLFTVSPALSSDVCSTDRVRTFRPEWRDLSSSELGCVRVQAARPVSHNVAQFPRQSRLGSQKNRNKARTCIWPTDTLQSNTLLCLCNGPSLFCQWSIW